MCDVELTGRGRGKKCGRLRGHTGQHYSYEVLENRRIEKSEWNRSAKGQEYYRRYDATPHRRAYNRSEHRRSMNKHSDLMRHYGISLEEFKALKEAQGGVCAICKGPPKGRGAKNKDFTVDHDHDTGKVRGLLCGHCNRGIGMFLDDPQRLRAAAAYLEEEKVGTLQEP